MLYYYIFVSSDNLQRETGNGEDKIHKKKGKGKSSTSTKRSRAAAIHNLSERVCMSSINFSFYLRI